MPTSDPGLPFISPTQLAAVERARIHRECRVTCSCPLEWRHGAGQRISCAACDAPVFARPVNFVSGGH